MHWGGIVASQWNPAVADAAALNSSAERHAAALSSALTHEGNRAGQVLLAGNGEHVVVRSFGNAFRAPVVSVVAFLVNQLPHRSKRSVGCREVGQILKNEFVVLFIPIWRKNIHDLYIAPHHFHGNGLGIAAQAFHGVGNLGTHPCLHQINGPNVGKAPIAIGGPIP